MYIEILNNFLIQSTGNWFGDDEVIFQDAYASRQRGNWFKVINVYKINNISREQSRSKFSWKLMEEIKKKMFHEKVQLPKEIF